MAVLCWVTSRPVLDAAIESYRLSLKALSATLDNAPRRLPTATSEGSHSSFGGILSGHKVKHILSGGHAMAHRSSVGRSILRRPSPLKLAAVLVLALALDGPRASAAFFEPGDANGDCYVTPDDVALIHYMSVGTIDPDSEAGDPNCYFYDQVITSRDVLCAGTKSQSSVYSQECLDAIVPDPATIAPPLDPKKPFLDSASFLYSSTPPVQREVDAAKLKNDRAAILTGRVTKRSGVNLPGVMVSVLGRPEYGYTHSRSDGGYDMVVNGGELLTLVYGFEGYATVHRRISPKGNDFNRVEDVAMVKLDVAVSTVQLNAASMQVHQSSVSEDSAGVRKATVLVPAGTEFQLMHGVDPETGEELVSQPSSLNIRATEFTVGPNGPKAMPAPLPLTTAYTYAVEISADEAIDSGAIRVDFSQPLILYVENFRNFPHLGVVPTGYYDYEKAAWVPSLNGQIVKITTIRNGLAELDINYETAVPPVSAEERAQLAVLYPVGQSLWRVPIPHLTPWDLNWPFGPPEGAYGAGADSASGGGGAGGGGEGEGGGGATGGGESKSWNDEEDDCDKLKKGSVIECTNGVLMEELPLAGLPFYLQYRSDRVPGHRESYQAEIRLHDGPLPNPAPKRIDLQVSIAGQVHKSSYDPTPNTQTVDFEWDGKNAYGQVVRSATTADVAIGYVYDAQYYAPADFDEAFGAYSETLLEGDSSNSEVIIWSHFPTILGPRTARDPLRLGLGGWTLSILEDLKIGDYAAKFAGSIPPSIGTALTTVRLDLMVPLVPQEPEVPYVPDCRDIAVDKDGRVYCAVLQEAVDSEFAKTTENLKVLIYEVPKDSTEYETPQEKNAPKPAPTVVAFNEFDILWPTANSATWSTPYVPLSMKVRNNHILVLFFNGMFVDFDQTTGEFASRQLLPEELIYGPQQARDFEVDDDGNVYLVGDFSWDVHDARLLKVAPDGAIYDDIRDPGFHLNAAYLALDRKRRKLFVGKLPGRLVQTWGVDVDGRQDLAAELNLVIPQDSLFGCETVDPQIQVIALTNGTVSGLAGHPINDDCAAPFNEVDYHGGLDLLPPEGFAGPSSDFPVFWGNAWSDIDIDEDGHLYMIYSPDGYGTFNRVYRISPDGWMAPFYGGEASDSVLGTVANPANHPNITPLGFKFGNYAIGSGVRFLSVSDDFLVVRSYETNHREVVRISSTPVTVPLATVLEGQTFAIGPSADGTVLHVFDDQRSHIMDIDPYSGLPVQEISYWGSSGRLAGVVDASGNEAQITPGVGTATISAFGMEHVLTFNSQGYLESITYPDQATYSFTYGETPETEGLLTQFIPPKGLGYASSFEYDSGGRLVKDTNAEGNFTSLAREDTASGFRVTTATAEERSVVYERYTTEDDESVVETTAVVPEAQNLVMTEVGSMDGAMYQVESAGGTLVEAMFVPHPVFGDTVGFLSDLLISPASTTLSPQTLAGSYSSTPSEPSFPWEITGEVFEVVRNGDTAHPARFEVTRTASGSSWHSLSREGRTFDLEYDSQNRLTSWSVPGVEPTYYFYDFAGRLTRIEQGVYATELGFDGASPFSSSLRVQEQAASGEWGDVYNVAFTRDEVGRPTKLASDSTEVDVEFDEHGNPTSISKAHASEDPLPDVYSYLFDKVDKVVLEVLPDILPASFWLEYEYDMDGLPTGVYRPSADLTVERDSVGRAATVNYTGGTATYGYDTATGRLATITDNGANVEVLRDGPLVTGVSSSNGAGDSEISISYDSEWNMSAIGVANGELELEYDRDGQLLSSTGVLGQISSSCTCSYDPESQKNGLLSSCTVGDLETAYTYDTYGRLQEVLTTLPGEQGLAFSYRSTHEYSGIMQRSVFTEEVQIGGEAVQSIDWSYFYDAEERLAEAQRVIGGNTWTYGYSYDTNGNRVQDTVAYNGEAVGTVDCVYDSHDRLVNCSSVDFTYSPDDNLVNRFDGSQSTEYEYDMFKRLHSVDLPGGPNGEPEVEYALDALDRRVAKSYGGIIERRWVYLDALRPLAEVDEFGDVETLFVYTGESFVPSSMIRAGEVFRLLTNAQGSVRFVVNVDTGVVAQELEYDPFGKVTTDTNPGFQPFGFAGGLYDPDTGLVRFGHRDYDPGTGRWTTGDPIGILGGDTNFLAYAGNDPVNYVDRDGLRPLDEYRHVDPVSGRWVNPPDMEGLFQAQLDILSLATGVGEFAALGKAALRGGMSWWLKRKASKEAIEGGIELAGGICKSVWGKVGGAVSGASKGVPKCPGGVCGKGICFVAGTPVATKDGPKPIEEVEEGDLVLSRNEETGEVGYRPVVGTFVNHDKRVIELHVVDGEDSPSTLGVTPEHPFWVVEKGWVQAGDLLPGDELFTSRGGWLRVTGSTWRPETATVYNFEVADFHTYFAGEAQAWVHNTCPPLRKLHPDSSLSPSKLDGMRKGRTDDLIESLKPGKPEALRVKPDGTVMNGHHRLKVLEERGIDVNSLPREPY